MCAERIKKIQIWKLDDLHKIESIIVREIRGSFSQERANRIMGLANFNGIAKIESGKRRILWSEFLLLANNNNINVVDIFKTINLKISNKSIQNDAQVMKVLCYGFTGEYFKNVSGWKSDKIVRIKTGKTPLRLIDVLVLLAHNELYLSKFVSACVSADKLPAVLTKKLNLFANHDTIISDAWIGLFLTLNSLALLYGEAPTKSSIEKAFCLMTQMGSKDYKVWIKKMEQAGAIDDSQDDYEITMTQKRFKFDHNSGQTFVKWLGQTMLKHHDLPMDKKEIDALGIQYLPLDEKSCEIILDELIKLRVMARELSLKNIEQSDRTMIFHSFFFNPLDENYILTPKKD